MSKINGPILIRQYIQALRVNIDGENIGVVRERATWWNPVIHIFDSVGNQVGLMSHQL